MKKSLFLAALAIVAPALHAQELLIACYGTTDLCRSGLRGHKPVNIETGVGAVDVAVADKKTAYASRPGSNDVAVVDLTTNAVIAGITHAAMISPQKMAMNAARTRLYVACDAAIVPIDITLQSNGSRPNVVVPTEIIALSLGSGALTVAVSGSKVAIGTASGFVSLYQGTTLVGSLPLGNPVSHVTFSPDGSKLYVAMTASTGVFDQNTNFVIGNLIVINTATLGIRSVIDLGAGSYLGAAVFSGSYLYTTGFTFGQVFALDSSTDVLAATIPAGSQMYGIANTDGKIYATDNALNVVAEITRGSTPSRYRLTNSIQLPPGSAPRGIGIIPKR